ncbi:hypothetical protein DMQ18_08780 [Klebsiella pneumoniae]|nr:hypothetical protein DMQ18_08780 [Klebsiella pneumoniae]
MIASQLILVAHTVVSSKRQIKVGNTYQFSSQRKALMFNKKLYAEKELRYQALDNKIHNKY